MRIEVSFLGVPRIAIEGSDARIQQKKLLALLFYVLYNGRCTREELAGIFWGGLGEESSRQNLRNALHRLKKILGCEVLDTLGNTSVAVRPQIAVRRDTDLLIADGAGAELLAFRSFVFLEKFYLRDTPDFDGWVTSMRTAYEKIATDRLENNMRESLRSDRSAAEKYAAKLLTVSPYHEEAARVLIGQYGNRGMYSEAIQVYKKLALRLEEDLRIEPEDETGRMYRAALEMRDIHDRHPQSWIASPLHERARDIILKQHDLFAASQKYCHCIVLGTLGAGKAQVIDAFVRGLESADFPRIRFEAANADIPFYAAGKILRLLGREGGMTPGEPRYADMETARLYHIASMDKLVQRIAARRRRVLLLIENMEMIDRPSMEIILTYLMDKGGGAVMIVGEYCSNFCPDRRAIERFELLDNVTLCRLPPLGRQDAISYLSTRLADAGRPDLDFYDIWRRTGGVLMLLEDVCARVRAGDEDVYAVSDPTLKKLTALLSSLQEEERACLELLSVFPHGASVEPLAALSGRSPTELSVTLEKLHQRELLREEDFESHLLTGIAVGVLREAVYLRISRTRRRELHQAAARFYERRSKLLLHTRPRDYHCLRELKWHFEMAGCGYEQIRYSLKELWYRLDYCDDFFPTIQNEPQLLDAFYLSKSETYREFDRHEAQLARLSNRLSPEQAGELGMIFDYLKGRTLIRDSRNAEGVALIHNAIRAAERFGRDDMLLKGYLEVVFSGIKTQNVPLMSEYILKAREIPTFADYHNENGILLRLEALCDIMAKRYGRAEALLLQSIEVLQNPRLQSYSYVNVAAAYDYLALICRTDCNYVRAEEFLRKAVSLCEQNNVKKSLDLLYTDLGYTLFLRGDYAAARENFKRSSEIYNRFDNYWMRSLGESCMAIICADEGESEAALEYYRRAEIYSRKDRLEEELAVLNRARERLEESGIL